MNDIDLDILYKDNTIPLERVFPEDIEPDCTYITKDGSRIKVLDDMDVIVVKRSPLNTGVSVNSLSNEQALKLFFRLLDKNVTSTKYSEE